jgi:gamma-glutamyl phosphate reductase
VDVGEKYEMYIKAMFISIEELGLKVDYDEKEKKVVLKDKSKEKYMPKLKDYMGKEEVKLKSSWTNAAVIERNIAAEGEPEVKRKYLLLDTSMKTMLRMKSVRRRW